MNATCIMGQAVCRRACAQHAEAAKNSACRKQRRTLQAACSKQQDSAVCCICTKYLFRGLHSARGIHLYRLVWPLSGHRTPPALQPRTTRTRHGPHPFANRTRSPAPPRQGPPPVLLHRLAAPYLHGMRAMVEFIFAPSGPVFLWFFRSARSVFDSILGPGMYFSSSQGRFTEFKIQLVLWQARYLARSNLGH